jgi:hypothetical protein
VGDNFDPNKFSAVHISSNCRTLNFLYAKSDSRVREKIRDGLLTVKNFLREIELR